MIYSCFLQYLQDTTARKVVFLGKVFHHRGWFQHLVQDELPIHVEVVADDLLLLFILSPIEVPE